MYLGNVFTFWLISYVLKILAKKSLKDTFLAKISVFWAINAKIFKNKKLIKNSEITFPRYVSFDGFGKV